MTCNRKQSVPVFLHNPLKPVPGRRRNPFEFFVQILFEIQNDQRQVAIPQNQIRRFQGLKDSVATNPEQKGVIRNRFKTILAVDQGDILRDVLHRLNDFM